MPTIDQVDAILRARLTAVVRGVASEVLERLVIRTPVKTGLARTNWFVRVGAPAVTSTTQAEPSGQLAISRGQEEIAQAPLGQPIHLSNHLPYIGRLEEGWSSQAPHGMLALTTAEVPQIVDQVVGMVSHGHGP